MFKLLRVRSRQGHRTIDYPKSVPAMPDRFRGLLALDAARCREGCSECITVCPTDALERRGAGILNLDLGKCLFCGACEAACPTGALQHTADFRMATRARDDLLLSGQPHKLALALDQKARKIFGRSLRLRVVSAGGCNACEADINVLTTVVFDIARFGIDIVASPRHADALLLTGPVTENMRLALEKTYQAIPAPKLVIASGACAISGGPFAGLPAQHDGGGRMFPIDLYIPGCPPHPLTVLDGLLRLLDRLPVEK